MLPSNPKENIRNKSRFAYQMGKNSDTFPWSHGIVFYVTSGKTTVHNLKLTDCQAKLKYSSYCKLAQIVKFQLALI